MKRIVRRAVIVVAALALAGAVIMAFLPEPIEADAARVGRGPLRVTVEEEGETRCRNRFVVAAPIAGRLERPKLDEGRGVSTGEVVARIYPTPIDTRQQAEANARVYAARATLDEAQALRARAEADAQQATRSRTRAERLVEDGLIAREQHELTATAETTALEVARAARARVERARSEVEQTQAALLAARADQSAPPVILTAPAHGVVLRVLEESERIVSAGTPILELGDPSALEVLVDVLTSDAAAIRPGAAVDLGDWGGIAVRGAVRAVEPAAFTKVSALGVEEQRVNVIVDVTGAPGALGVGYRVLARIVVWESARALKVPTGALVRAGEAWGVFAVVDGRARLRTVEIGHRGMTEVEVVSGLEEGEQVLVHPPNDLSDGSKVRESGAG
jgi:HlyD family secretion protein